MSDSYARLERLARAASPGRWHWHGGRPFCASEYGGDVHLDGLFGGDWEQTDQAYISAAHPATILALISRLRKLEAVAQAAREDSVLGHKTIVALEALDRAEKAPP